MLWDAEGWEAELPERVKKTLKMLKKMPCEGKMPPAAGETAGTEAAPELSEESRGQEAAQKQDCTQK